MFLALRARVCGDPDDDARRQRRSDQPGRHIDGRHYYLCRQMNAELPDGAQRLEAWLLKMIGA